MTKAEVMEYIVEKNAKLEPCDFDCMAVVQHSDGSFFRIENALIEKIGDEWVLIFSEHHWPMFYSQDEMDFVLETTASGKVYPVDLAK